MAKFAVLLLLAVAASATVLAHGRELPTQIKVTTHPRIPTVSSHASIISESA